MFLIYYFQVILSLSFVPVNYNNIYASSWLVNNYSFYISL